VILVVVIAHLFVAIYGAAIIAYSRLLKNVQSHRNADEYLGATTVYFHDCFIELPMGIAIRGEPDRTGVLQIGGIKLPIPHHETVGWFLVVASFLSATTVGVYLWRRMLHE
jgi:hypothetical protein